MLKRVLLYVLVLSILLAAAFTAGQQDGNEELLQQYAGDISSWLGSQEEQALSISKNLSYSSGTSENDAGQVFTILLHQEDSLEYWSNNNIIPSPYDLKQLAGKTGSRLVQLPLGWFYAHVDKSGNRAKTILIPIRYSLDFNHKLSGVFPANKKIPAQVLLGKEDTAYPISINGSNYGFIQSQGQLQTGWQAWLKLGLWALFFVTLLSLVWQLAKYANRRFGIFAGTAVIAALSLGAAYYNVNNGWAISNFGGLSLFKDQFKNANLIGHSIGDWLINVVLFVYLMAFMHGSIREKSREKMPVGLRIGLATLSNLLALLGIPLLISAVRQLVFNNFTGFDFDNILSIGASGFLTLAGLVGLMMGLFLFGHRLALGIRDLHLKNNQRFIAIAASTLLLALISGLFGVEALYAGICGLVYAIALDFFVNWEANGFGWLVVWMLLFSLWSSTLLYRFNDKRISSQRMAYAEALASERDTSLAENLLPTFREAILHDSSQISQILKPWPFKGNIKELRASLNSLALRHPYLFQHYRLETAAFDQENQPILIGQTYGYQEVVKSNWEQASALEQNPDIRYLTVEGGKFRYMIRCVLGRAADVTQRVQLFVMLDHEYPPPSKSYSQIFYTSPYKGLGQLSRYNFAVQKEGRIVVEQGRGSIPALSASIGRGEVEEVYSTVPLRVDAVAKSQDGKTIASVGKSVGSWLKQVYLFAIIFTLISFLLLVAAFANSFLNFLPEAYDFRLTTKGSLARRIHLWNVSLLVVSFFVVGYLTYKHFTDSAKEAERIAFDYKVEAMQNNLEAPFLDNTDSSFTNNRSALQTSMQQITKSLSADANLFDPEGNLIYSTRQDLVALGILPAKLSKPVQNALSKNNIPETEELEQIGGQEFYCKYRPCHNGRGELLGFLGVPHQPDQHIIRAEVSDFIGVLASLYVFLLLIAFVITYVLSRSIIRPLSLLSDKVKDLKLEDKNDPLEYEGDAQDEVSELIGQYNIMVDKLEASKVQLVRLEREGAWREMAKQVAHDIKNPLTTMKLSMQQLERVSNNPEQAAAYLRKAITRLIEQIDSLAQIASEFSMFANLDIRNKNDVVINEVVESVHDLFSEQKNVSLELKLPKDRYHILGDKNHLIRVFNNLVINAIQSVPSDRTGSIKVSLTKQGHSSVVKISDNGGGIPPEIAERVFEPNFTTKTSGSGLGLAICKKIIEAHEGNIRFETRENEGTDFFVEIPITAYENGTPAKK
ncbi:MAG: HAMP domain-containing sensor histidine kinase [Saprospiraceae bacterium]